MCHIDHRRLRGVGRSDDVESAPDTESDCPNGGRTRTAREGRARALLIISVGIDGRTGPCWLEMTVVPQLRAHPGPAAVYVARS